MVGVNYLASHAGLFMWRDWDGDQVRRDLDLLAGQGFSLLRVFPLWPDFQPVTLLRGIGGEPREYRFGEAVLPDDEYGRSGVDRKMIERFDFLVESCGALDLKLNVSVINGWMSGRLFVPPALEGHNPLTDPEAMMWALRLAGFLARRYAGNPAIVGWDLGNEVNCMGSASREHAWVWSNAIANAIRTEDPETPVVSGMHGLTLDGAWRIADQAECVDVLTTHPYSVFVPHCDNEGADSLRTVSHPVAESLYYGDISGKPVLCQETNTLGPMLAGPEQMRRFARTAAVTLWAHGIGGVVWWCAFDQSEIRGAPYDWNALERELGLFSALRQPKPVAEEFRQLGSFFAASSRDLPRHRRDAVCILSGGQDHWAVAFSTFLLSKQAGFDVRFVSSAQALPESPLYLLPSLRGYEPVSRTLWNQLKQQVRNGAHLYVSLDGAFLTEFEEVFGLQVLHRQRRTRPATVRIDSIAAEEHSVQFPVEYQTTYAVCDAEVLGTEADGMPLFVRHEDGAGTVFLLTIPVERGAAGVPGFFDAIGSEGERCRLAWWRVYARFARRALESRIVSKSSPNVFLSEHYHDSRTATVVAMNMTDSQLSDHWTLRAGWNMVEARTVPGNEPVDWEDVRNASGECRRVRIQLPEAGALVLGITRSNS
jgi:hypothetical protein